ncbi:hypothetical protein CEXT_297111 [Caerostris extrusa]|uniref:Uncharacterized protein n=1 Tax=Caerostris extrusa TaxID=172846 RepID=A0AAV4MEW4_CAEEX|nr:hypothetical protein CEXT_297111 [Caerostris extrusa]
MSINFTSYKKNHRWGYPDKSRRFDDEKRGINERRINRNRSDDPSMNKRTSDSKVPIHEEHELFQNDTSKKIFNKYSANELVDGKSARKSNPHNDRNSLNSNYQNRYNTPRGNSSSSYNKGRFQYQSRETVITRHIKSLSENGEQLPGHDAQM